MNMKRSITITTPDGQKMALEMGTKLTVEDFTTGEDALYGTVYNRAFIDKVVNEGNILTVRFRSDYTKKELHATK